jgi:hypothetical protein
LSVVPVGVNGEPFISAAKMSTKKCNMSVQNFADASMVSPVVSIGSKQKFFAAIGGRLRAPRQRLWPCSGRDFPIISLVQSDFGPFGPLRVS